MAPPPTARDLFFARNQYSILMGACVTQLCHYNYIKKTEPAFETQAVSLKNTLFPRTLRAGLGWGVVFIALLTEISRAKESIRDHKDPVKAQSFQRSPWKPRTQSSDNSS